VVFRLAALAVVALVLSSATAQAAVTWGGLLYNNNIPARDGTLQTGLVAKGYDTLIYGSGASSNPVPAFLSSQPSWITSASRSTVAGLITALGFAGITWDSVARPGIVGDGDGRGGTYDITLTPNGITDLKIAIILTTWDSSSNSSFDLQTVTVGITPTTFNQTFFANSGKATVGEITVTGASQPITLRLKTNDVGYPPAPDWYGVTLGIQQIIPEPSSLSLLGCVGLMAARRRRS